MIPPTLAANPSLDRWVEFLPDRKVHIRFGKVEYGQGAMTALAHSTAMTTRRTTTPPEGSGTIDANC